MSVKKKSGSLFSSTRPRKKNGTNFVKVLDGEIYLAKENNRWVESCLRCKCEAKRQFGIIKKENGGIEYFKEVHL